MTYQRIQDSAFSRTIHIVRKFLSCVRELFPSIIRELTPPRAWLRGFIVAYLGTRILLFVMDNSDSGLVAESRSDRPTHQTAVEVKPEPSIPIESAAEIGHDQRPIPIISVEGSALDERNSANALPSAWRTTFIVMLVLLAIEFVVNLAAGLVTACMGWIRYRWAVRTA